VPQFSLFSEEPHRVNLDDLVGTLEAMPAGLSAASHDGATRLMFYERADPVPRSTAEHPVIKELRPQCSRDRLSIPRCCRESDGRVETLSGKPA
jgi:hypothetical protein